MRRSHGFGVLIGDGYRAVAILAALLVMIGLAFRAGSARASETAATATVASAAKALSATLAGTTLTPPSGDFAFTLDLASLGISESDMQKVIDDVKAKGGAVTANFRRNLAEFDLGIPGENTFPWENFNATLSVTPTTFSVTIPHGEFQASASWWVSWLIHGLAATIGYAIRGACVAYTGLDVLCTPVGAAITAFLDGVLTQAVDGTLSDPGAWAETLVTTMVAALGGYIWEKYAKPFFKNDFKPLMTSLGQWISRQATSAWSWMGTTITAGLDAMGQFIQAVAGKVSDLIGTITPARTTSQPCDIYAWDGTPCTAAYSMDRALYSYYNGPLYQVKRASDGTRANIGLLAKGGYVNAARQDSFCASTTCTITKVYDQSPQWNDLTVEGAGGAAGADGPARAGALPITVHGHKAYGLDITGQVGYRDNSTRGIAVNGAAESMYMVASGTHVNSGCCFDFGNAETNTRDNGVGHMDAVNLTTWCGSNSAPCHGGGPWVEADMENGQWTGDGSNAADTGNASDFVTAMLGNNGQTTFRLKGGNAQSGGLTTYWNGPLPSGYAPMRQEGAIVLGTGGDNSNWDVGSFFEGVMTQGLPTGAADAAVQADIVSAGYAGNSAGPGGIAGGSSAADPAVTHSGYSSVYTVNSANGHLEESYLPAMGDAWSRQDLSAKYGTPPVLAGTRPVAVTHCGYTSVYTVDAANGDLQETYLPAIGDAWRTQNLSANYGTPPTSETPTAVVHRAGATGAAAACGFTSVYTVDAASGALQETYLPALGGGWTTQNLSANYGTPHVQAGTSPSPSCTAGTPASTPSTPTTSCRRPTCPPSGTRGAPRACRRTTAPR